MFEPDYATPPGWTIQELREEQSISTHDFAAYLGLTVPELKELDEGLLPIDPLLAERLEYATGQSERFWLQLEANYRNDLALGRQVTQTWK